MVSGGVYSILFVLGFVSLAIAEKRLAEKRSELGVEWGVLFFFLSFSFQGLRIKCFVI